MEAVEAARADGVRRVVARDAHLGVLERVAALCAPLDRASSSGRGAARKAEAVRVVRVPALEVAVARAAQVVVALGAVEHQRALAVAAAAPIALPHTAVLAVCCVRVCQHHCVAVAALQRHLFLSCWHSRMQMLGGKQRGAAVWALCGRRWESRLAVIRHKASCGGRALCPHIPERKATVGVVGIHNKREEREVLWANVTIEPWPRPPCSRRLPF